MKASSPLAQRSSSDRHWEPTDVQCLTALVLLVVLFFRQVLLGSAYLWEDFLYQWYPFRIFAAVTMARGEMPLWNPYTFNGMPFLADIQTQVFYLPLTVLALAVRDGRLGVWWLELINVVHYAVAGIGMFYLAKSFALRRIPALLAAVAYTFSGFMITHAIHQVITLLVCWYPWVLLLVRKSFAETGWRWVFVAGLVLGHSFFAGFPQLSLFLYFFLFIYVVFELLTTFSIRGLFSRPALVIGSKGLAIVLLSLGITAIQLLPTLELSQLSVRAEISYQKSTEGSLAWSQLLTLLVPKLFGVADAHGYNYWGPGAYWYYWETCIYLGVVPFLLTLLASVLVKRNKYIPFFLGLGLFAVLFALGGNFVVQKLFFSYVPGFSTFRNPARMTIFLAFAGALLSAFTLQYLLYDQRQPGRDKTLRTVLYATVGTAIVLWALISSGGISSLVPSLGQNELAPYIQRQAQIALVFVLLGGGLCFWLLRHSARSWALALAAVAVVYIDMEVFGAEQNTSPVNPAEYFRRSAPLVDWLKRDDEIFRVNTRATEGLVMDRNQGMVDRIFQMEGYTPLVLQRAYPQVGSTDRMFDMLNVKYKTVMDKERGALALQFHETYLPRAFMVYAFHVAETEEQLVSYLKGPSFNPRTVAVLERDPGFTLPAEQAEPTWSVRIREYRNNKISLALETSHSGLLVLSEIYYPGWRAAVDGHEAEIFRTDYSLRSLLVPAGSHEVNVEFDPPSYARGKLITIVTLGVCLIGVVVSEVRRRR